MKAGDMQFDFTTPTRIIFGSGTVKQVGTITRELGQRALVITGSDSRRAEPLLEIMRSSGIDVATFSVAGEPTVATIDDGISAAKKHDADCVIGFGGGSALDAGKSITVMTPNGGEVLDYLEVIGRGKAFNRPSLPFVAIPTTAGTGAEVTRNAVIGSPEHRAKASLRSPHMLPRVAIIDPELTRHLPPAITAASGMDALTQLIEPFVCSRATPVTDAFCREGIQRCARSLQRAVEDGESVSAREDMALASMLGGLALSNAGLGAVHGFANPIGGMFPAPHGAICAALLPHVMGANLKALRSRQPNSLFEQRYAEVASILTGNATARPEEGIGWVRNLVEQLHIPKLRTFSVSEAAIPELVEKSQKASSMKANPIQLMTEELSDILRQAI
jgi:alcohol dehydrogenase class IV